MDKTPEGEKKNLKYIKIGQEFVLFFVGVFLYGVAFLFAITELTFSGLLLFF